MPNSRKTEGGCCASPHTCKHLGMQASDYQQLAAFSPPAPQAPPPSPIASRSEETCQHSCAPLRCCQCRWLIVVHPKERSRRAATAHPRGVPACPTGALLLKIKVPQPSA